MTAPYISSRFPHTVGEKEYDKIRQVLQHAVHFYHHLTRTGDDLKYVWMELNALDGKYSQSFQWTLTPSGPNLIEENPATVVVDERARLGMTVFNQTDIDLYPYLFYFDPSDLSISVYFACKATASTDLGFSRVVQFAVWGGGWKPQK